MTLRNIITLLTARLELIQVAKSYNTDAGLHVYYGLEEAQVNDDRLPMINISIDSESAEPITSGQYRVTVMISLDCYLIADDQATLGVLDITEDIRRAVESPDDDFGGQINAIIYDGMEQPESTENGYSASVRMNYGFVYDRGHGE